VHRSCHSEILLCLPQAIKQAATAFLSSNLYINNPFVNSPLQFPLPIANILQKMGVLTYFSYSSSERTEVGLEGKPGAVRETAENITGSSTQGEAATNISYKVPVVTPAIIEMTASAESASTEYVQDDARATGNQVKIRRFSLRSFSFVRKDIAVGDKPMLSVTREHELRENASAARLLKKAQLSKSQKKAQQSALAVRDIIIGPPPNVVAPRISPAFAKPQLSKIKSQLLDPKSAKQVIAHLKQLPLNDGSVIGDGQHGHGPIHAVCLEHTDAEEHLLHFANLAPPDKERSLSAPDFIVPAISSAPLDAVSRMFNEMQIVNLITSPDFGLGQPGSGDGILAGALPTPETVIGGIKQITPELMALGFATSKAITPDHSSVFILSLNAK